MSVHKKPTLVHVSFNGTLIYTVKGAVTLSKRFNLAICSQQLVLNP